MTENEELIEQLGDLAEGAEMIHTLPWPVIRDIATRAADALETLTAENERLRGALKPFAEACEHLNPATADDGATLDGIEVRQWRAAYAALNTERSNG